MSTPELPALLTPHETMAALRVSYPTLRRMIERGDLRAIRLGHGRGAPIRVPASELDRLLSESGDHPSVSAPSSACGALPTEPVPPEDVSFPAGGGGTGSDVSIRKERC